MTVIVIEDEPGMYVVLNAGQKKWKCVWNGFWHPLYERGFFYLTSDPKQEVSCKSFNNGYCANDEDDDDSDNRTEPSCLLIM